MKIMRKNTLGFSLVEVVLVMGVVTVLTTIAMFKYSGVLDVTKKKASELEMVEVKNAILLFEVDKGHLPQSLDHLKKLFDGDGYKYDSFGDPYIYDKINRKLCSNKARRCKRF